MPCDTLQVSAVDLTSLGKLDPLLMLAAIKALGHPQAYLTDGQIRFGRGEYVDIKTGKSQFASSTDVNTVKRSYAAQVVQYQAKKNNWNLKQTGPFEYLVSKRF